MPQQFIRKLTGKTRTREADIQLGLMLAFVAGLINAGGFLAIGKYTSHMTGIVSSIGDYVALHQFDAALSSIGFLLSFICGAAVTTLIVRWGRKREHQSQYALALLLEAALLLLFGLFAGHVMQMSVIATIQLLCFIMGLQNAIITKISNAEIRTTHMTGICTDIGIELGRYLSSFRDHRYKSIVQRYKLRLHGSLLASFTIGAIIGAVSFQHFGFSATVPIALLLVLAASVPIIDDFSK